MYAQYLHTIKMHSAFDMDGQNNVALGSSPKHVRFFALTGGCNENFVVSRRAKIYAARQFFSTGRTDVVCVGRAYAIFHGRSVPGGLQFKTFKLIFKKQEQQRFTTKQIHFHHCLIQLLSCPPDQRDAVATHGCQAPE